ncbi:hypothetical protein Fot_00501 [Forsythia ovata]|uniref:Uncharacterized protein n=1 Tax=Forsythia ovata TaxID=205694 RepID=A0ABD1X199_9LAMI
MQFRWIHSAGLRDLQDLRDTAVEIPLDLRNPTHKFSKIWASLFRSEMDCRMGVAPWIPAVDDRMDEVGGWRCSKKNTKNMTLKIQKNATCEDKTIGEKMVET